MSRLWDWPALEGATTVGLPPSLAAEQGIWGKVHGASSDFRWIAATRGFSSLGRDLEREVAVGIEDRPARFSLWRFGPEVHLAGVGYPSRARDASGRAGSLEKQVLAIRADPAIPPALAALLLLPLVAELDDRTWWGRADPGAWDADPRFVFDLGGPREVPMSEEALDRAVADGVEGLRAALPPDGAAAVLAETFTGLLGGRRPVLFPAAEGPLAPAALAALLLPLDRKRADRLSLAGWLPSSRPPGGELGERWDLVARPGGEAPRDRPADPDPRARRMAAAILAGDPSLLGGRRTPGPAIPTPPAPATLPIHEPWSGDDTGPGPTRAGSGGPPPLPVSPNLPEPPAGASRAWWLIHDLARDPTRFWLDPQDLAPHLADGHDVDDESPLSAALTWLRTLASDRPPGPAGEQHRAKEDLLRAAILALSPTPTTLDALGPFQSDRVPPVLYLTALPPDAWERARRSLGEGRIAELLRESRQRCAPELRARIARNLELR